MSNEIVPFDKQITLADAFAKSGFFGVKTREQALALMAVCESEGLHPAQAVQQFHIIQGRPALKSDAMLARFQNAGGKVEWIEYTDKVVKARFSHPQGGSVELDWTMERAKAANLTGKDNWKNYPRQMLRARVISEGVRTVYPGVTGGFYTPEEEGDIARPMRDITPKEASNATPPAPEPPPVETASLSEALDALMEAEVVSASGSEALTAYFNSLSAAVKDGMKALPNGAERIKAAMRNAKAAEQTALSA